MASHADRTLARQMAVQVLYESEIRGVAVDQVAAEPEPVPDGGALPAYAVQLLGGIQERGQAIDDLLSQASENWAVERMPAVDRAILRLAAYEILHVSDVPVAVSINEAVDLAKAFGGNDDSGRFVNGILGRIARNTVPAKGMTYVLADFDDAPDAEPMERPEGEAEADEGAAAPAADDAPAEDVPAADDAPADNAPAADDAPAEGEAPAAGEGE